MVVVVLVVETVECRVYNSLTTSPTTSEAALSEVAVPPLPATTAHPPTRFSIRSVTWPVFRLVRKDRKTPKAPRVLEGVESAAGALLVPEVRVENWLLNWLLGVQVWVVGVEVPAPLLGGVQLLGVGVDQGTRTKVATDSPANPLILLICTLLSLTIKHSTSVLFCFVLLFLDFNHRTTLIFLMPPILLSEPASASAGSVRVATPVSVRHPAGQGAGAGTRASITQGTGGGIARGGTSRSFRVRNNPNNNNDNIISRQVSGLGVVDTRASMISTSITAAAQLAASVVASLTMHQQQPSGSGFTPRRSFLPSNTGGRNRSRHPSINAGGRRSLMNRWMGIL